MQPKHGTITINAITDADLVKILQIKEKHERALQFNPQQLQPVSEPRPNAPSGQVGYNNAILTWSTEDGLTAILEILHALEHSQQP